MSKKPKTAWESFCDTLCIIAVLIGIGVICGLFWASKAHSNKYSDFESVRHEQFTRSV